MPDNGNGTYARPGGSQAVSGQVIQSSVYELALDDVAQALNNRTTQAQAQDIVTGYTSANITGLTPSVSGTVDAITLTTTPVLTSWPTGGEFTWVSLGYNTGITPTIQLGTLAAKNIKNADGTSLWPGALGPVGHICQAVYNGTEMRLLNPQRFKKTGNVANHTFTNLGGFKVVRFYFTDLKPATTNSYLVMRISTDGTTYPATADAFWRMSGWEGTTFTQFTNSAVAVRLGPASLSSDAQSSAANIAGLNGQIDVYLGAETTFISDYGFSNIAGTRIFYDSVGFVSRATSAIQFAYLVNGSGAASNIASGSIAMEASL